jgi:hypothetical protein
MMMLPLIRRLLQIPRVEDRRDPLQDLARFEVQRRVQIYFCCCRVRLCLWELDLLRMLLNDKKRFI